MLLRIHVVWPLAACSRHKNNTKWIKLCLFNKKSVASWSLIFLYEPLVTLENKNHWIHVEVLLHSKSTFHIIWLICCVNLFMCRQHFFILVQHHKRSCMLSAAVLLCFQTWFLGQLMNINCSILFNSSNTKCFTTHQNCIQIWSDCL